MGGAVFNATLSVNLDELSFLSAEIITSDSVTLPNNMNLADSYFGFALNGKGGVMLMNDKEKTVDEQIEDEINESIHNVNKILNEYKETNKDTTLTDSQILDIMSDFNDDGLVTF